MFSQIVLNFSVKLPVIVICKQEVCILSVPSIMIYKRYLFFLFVVQLFWTLLTNVHGHYFLLSLQQSDTQAPAKLHQRIRIIIIMNYHWSILICLTGYWWTCTCFNHVASLNLSILYAVWNMMDTVYVRDFLLLFLNLNKLRFYSFAHSLFMFVYICDILVYAALVFVYK